ncbi:MAG: hypothetical protein Q8K89_01265, partial [Actinomycetota bacterium]|nr:hypothetical protein [Actinomycetota bacterium]
MEEARFDQTGSTPTPQPAPSPLVAPAEPERPQWRAAAIVAGLVLVLAFGSWIGYVSITKRLSAARQLDHATTLLEKADA